MKRFVCCFLVLVLCASLTCSVFANQFVPSIGDKDAPPIVIIKDDNGNPAIGTIIDEDGQILDYVYEHCLIVTPVSKANTSTQIPEDSKTLLLQVYAALSDGSMQLPYEKFGSNIDASKMTIRDLYDATFVCDEHPVMLEPEGVLFQITFDLGVGEYTEVYTMTYKGNEWNPIVSTKNNGDGTVTCVFEKLCPVAFSVYAGTGVPAPDTGDNSNLVLWTAVLAVAAGALVLVIVMNNRKKTQAA